ncbi:MAG: hypothetical protein RL296_63 [Actinomycetota bacterium]
MATGIYIDGLNLYYGALRNTPYRWLDLELLSKNLFPRDEIVIIRYFTAPINRRNDISKSHSRQALYLRALRTLNSVKIHLGHFQSNEEWKVITESSIHPADKFQPAFKPRNLFKMMWRNVVRSKKNSFVYVQVLIEQEKGSDVNLSTRLLHDCITGLCDKAVVISNDSDLAGAITLSRQYVNEIGFINPHKTAPSKHLVQAAAFQAFLRPEVLSRSQFPQTVLDPKGREINRPKLWR